MQDNKLGKSYFETKMDYLKRLLTLLERVRKAIISSNLEVLNESLRGIEEVQSEINNIDREFIKTKASLSDEENSKIRDALADVINAGKSNEMLLNKEKENILHELKATNLKRNARNVYGNHSAGSLPMRNVG